MTWAGWLAIAAVVFAVAAFVLAVSIRRALRRRGISIPLPMGVHWGPGAEPDDVVVRPVAFVANPTKPGVSAIREAAAYACAARHLPEPLWFETTIEDPGARQTHAAIDAGAQVVVAVGGDGTVRAVAETLNGTGVPMGLLAHGTGNLLARNLDLPVGDPRELLRIALDGTDRHIDVGWLTIMRDENHPTDGDTNNRTDSDEDTSARVAGAASGAMLHRYFDHGPTQEHIFLVISGLGFDAAMVADTDEHLKARVGWIAYFVAGVKHLNAHRIRLQVSLDESPWQNVRLRTILIGNCGRLPGGFTLLPDAVIDDGWLDIAAIDTRGGLMGWGHLFGKVALQRFKVPDPLRNSIGRIDHARARAVRVRGSEARPVQVDGDIIGTAFEVAVRVEHKSLTVRVPDGDASGHSPR